MGCACGGRSESRIPLRLIFLRARPIAPPADAVEAQVWGATVGVTTAGTVEMSNVDLTQEFTNMIIAQRGFQANGRVITSTDEMLQEIVNLKR